MPSRILVIDDEPQITRVLRAALSAQGYDIRTANDPEEGLRVFKDWPPDLVITDLMMPGMSADAGVDIVSPRARALEGGGAGCGRRRLRNQAFWHSGAIGAGSRTFAPRAGTRHGSD
jgi:CheY-like chemotaxis protein